MSLPVLARFLHRLPHRLLQRLTYGTIAIVTLAIVLFSHLGWTQALPKQQGQFRVEYGPVADAVYEPLRQAFKEARLYEDLAVMLNKIFKLPTDVTIVLSACGAENAFYDPGNKQIVMCDELMGHFAQMFAPEAQSEQGLGESILYTQIFVFFHELGHGLVDIFDLPTVGREEDAVDEFSTLLLLEAGEEGEKAVLNAADWFRLQSQATGDQLAFWDEHSLDMQRFFGMACLVYGKEPNKFSGLVENEILPMSRAERCGAEYQKKYRSWEKLLAPHVNEEM